MMEQGERVTERLNGTKVSEDIAAHLMTILGKLLDDNAIEIANKILE